MPKSSLSVDSVFQGRLEALRKAVQLNAVQQQLGRSKWLKLGKDSDEAEAIIDGYDHDLIAKAYNRNGTSKAYLDAVDHTDPGTNIETKVAKIQGDMLSALERDLRLRHRSRARIMAHGVAKQTSQGLLAGAITGTMLQTVRNLVQITENTAAPERATIDELPVKEQLDG